MLSPLSDLEVLWKHKMSCYIHLNIDGVLQSTVCPLKSEQFFFLPVFRNSVQC